MGAETITLRSRDPQIEISALLDGAGAAITGGYGGWEIINRPRRQGVTHWGGRNPFQMNLALILDGHANFQRVETDCSRMERLALPHPNPGGTPPVVTFAETKAIPHSDLEWVVENIEWGEAIRDNQGNRTRQHVVLNLLRYVKVDIIQVSAAENARNKGGGKSVRTIDVRAGDTLQKIAARELKDNKRWKEIQKLNPNIKDPSNLKGIAKVKIPAK